MKNYSPKIAAQMIVRRKTLHGVSRHKSPGDAAQLVTSVLTEKAHVSSLSLFAKWLLAQSGRHLKNATRLEVQMYLDEISKTRRQSTVSLARQAINLHLYAHAPLTFVRSKVATEPQNRAYTKRQIALLIASAECDLAFSIRVAENAGLRAMELSTIARPSDFCRSNRNWNAERFGGRNDDVEYVVHGKGGLKREVRLCSELAKELETMRRDCPIRVSNRGAHLVSNYQLLGSQQFSICFSRHSMKILGFTLGGHGLRHSFAQRRRDEYLQCGMSLSDAVPILSQEMGHFASKNTWAYLRDCES